MRNYFGFNSQHFKKCSLFQRRHFVVWRAHAMDGQDFKFPMLWQIICRAWFVPFCEHIPSPWMSGIMAKKQQHSLCPERHPRQFLWRMRKYLEFLGLMSELPESQKCRIDCNHLSKETRNLVATKAWYSSAIEYEI